MAPNNWGYQNGTLILGTTHLGVEESTSSGFRAFTGPWFAGHEGMKKNVETTIMGYIRTTVRIQSFIPS